MAHGGDALFNLDRYGDAVESYRRDFIRRDLAYDALMRLGQAFSAMGRPGHRVPGRRRHAEAGFGRAAGAAQWAAARGTGRAWRRSGDTAAGRSIPLAAPAEVLELPDCEFVSLQYDEVTTEVAAANAGRAAPIRSFPEEATRDFEELAGLVANLDVVVLVQTAVVHLCGALGTPCLTLVPQNPEWRYGAQGPATSWYRSVRLFRQPSPGAWQAPLQQVAGELRRGLSIGAV